MESLTLLEDILNIKEGNLADNKKVEERKKELERKQATWIKRIPTKWYVCIYVAHPRAFAIAIYFSPADFDPLPPSTEYSRYILTVEWLSGPSGLYHGPVTYFWVYSCACVSQPHALPSSHHKKVWLAFGQF